MHDRPQCPKTNVSYLYLENEAIYLRERRYIMGWSFGWLPLINDTAILVLTVYKLLPPLKNQQASYVVKQLFQDGILYYL